jgi:hypothetical protein
MGAFGSTIRCGNLASSLPADKILVTINAAGCSPPGLLASKELGVMLIFYKSQNLSPGKNALRRLSLKYLQFTGNFMLK